MILAQDENLGRRVAIKRPLRSAVERGIARFRVEAKAATLRHPNIPTVYQMGAHDDLPFIAMEYVEGETLEAIIAGGRELDLMTRLRIMEQVGSALGCAHKSGIVHRDIKPANIMVRPDGTAKIIDFGHARLQEDEPGFVTAGQAARSERYIAPECFTDGKADGRADIFSAGVTLFRLLTGVEPVGMRDGADPRLGAHLPDYPPALDRILEKSLAANPADRYQSAEDFADGLREVIAGLKRARVAELFKEAERLNTAAQDAPALKLLDEAIRLDASHPGARRLRKAIREHQERARSDERQHEYLLKSDAALRAGNFEEALGTLKDALALDPSSDEVKRRILAVEERKRRFENSTRALAEAEDVKAHGDAAGALHILTRALEQDPGNEKLGRFHAALSRLITIDAQRGRFMDLEEGATRALAERKYDAAEELLIEAAEIDPSAPGIETLRRELGKAREMEQHLAQLAEIRQRVHERMREDAYEAAMDLIQRALKKMPNEIVLHRLKAEVDAQAGRFDVRSIIDLTISRANEVFASSPFEALAIVEKASEAIPGDERLAACERALRGQLEGRRSGQLRDETMRRARELIDARQADKAVGVLESFQGKFGPHVEIDGLLMVARGQVARRRA